VDSDPWREVLADIDSVWLRIQERASLCDVPHQSVCVAWEHWHSTRNAVLSWRAQQQDETLRDPTDKMTAQKIAAGVTAPQTEKLATQPGVPDSLARLQRTHPAMAQAAIERLRRKP
jgi:hypothetical protein